MVVALSPRPQRPIKKIRDMWPIDILLDSHIAGSLLANLRRVKPERRISTGDGNVHKGRTSTCVFTDRAAIWESLPRRFDSPETGMVWVAQTPTTHNIACSGTIRAKTGGSLRETWGGQEHGMFWGAQGPSQTARTCHVLVGPAKTTGA